jgi:hypothetical protein
MDINKIRAEADYPPLAMLPEGEKIESTLAPIYDCDHFEIHPTHLAWVRLQRVESPLGHIEYEPKSIRREIPDSIFREVFG